MPPAKIASATILIASSRRVSFEIAGELETGRIAIECVSVAILMSALFCLVSGIFFIPVTDSIKSFDLCKVGVDNTEFFAHPFDMAVNSTVINICLFIICCV